MSQDHDLHFFSALARAGNLTQAGAVLGVSTATVSKRLKRLEQRLGIRLATRDARSFALTEAGQYFLQQSLRLTQEICELECELAGWGESGAASLRVGISDGIYDRLMAPVVAAFAHARPDIALHLVVSGHAARPAEQGLACLFLTGHPDDFGKRLKATPICEAPLVTCATPAYLDKRGRPESPEDLSSHACLAATTRQAQRRTFWQFARDGQRVSVRISPRLSALGWQLRTLALEHLGIARLPRHLVEREVRCGQLEVVLTDWTDADLRGVYMLHEPDVAVMPGLDVFIGYVHRHFRIEAPRHKMNHLSPA